MHLRTVRRRVGVLPRMLAGPPTACPVHEAAIPPGGDVAAATAAGAVLAGVHGGRVEGVVTDPATTSRIINRHMARTLSWLEELGCPEEFKEQVRAGFVWLREDLTGDLKIKRYDPDAVPGGNNDNQKGSGR
jgi:hypothetical protein